MKRKIFMNLLTVVLFGSNAFASNNDLCSVRYIIAAEKVVAESIAFNKGEISRIGFAANVAAIESELAYKRIACTNESEKSVRCVEKTKPGYQKIRSKVNVRRVVLGQTDKVRVSELDLIRLLKGVFVCPAIDIDEL
jgi:hypothetical protein